MKKIAATVLLVLLLCNMLGLSLAVFFSGQDYRTASHNRDRSESKTLKSSQSSRDRFFELAGIMQQMHSPERDASESPYGKIVKLLGNFSKLYLPTQTSLLFSWDMPAAEKITGIFMLTSRAFYSLKLLQLTPPPERC